MLIKVKEEKDGEEKNEDEKVEKSGNKLKKVVKMPKCNTGEKLSC